MRNEYLITLLALGMLLPGCANRAQRPVERHVQSPASLLPTPFHNTVTIITTNRVIFVGGEVKQPGRFIWTDGVTLTDAIQMAGGFTDFANRSQLELRRSDGSLELRGYAAVVRGLTNNPVLGPNDQLYVGKKFYLPPEVWGALRALL